MIKTEKNVATVGTEVHGEKVETVIRGNYVDVVTLTVNLLARVSETLGGNDVGDQVSALQSLYLTTLDELKEKAK